MDTWSAFAKGLAARHKESMVFDWDKAAELIRERKPKVVWAGLQDDWEWTGGIIYENGNIIKDSHSYLASTWAVPQIDLDGEIISCYKMQSEAPDWHAKTRWPQSALSILEG